MSPAGTNERLDFTGERYVPWLPGQIRYEHLHRYTSVLPLCTNKRVLDVACGEGYGSALLARDAADVVGVDIDEATIAHATRNYAGPNLRFVRSSALSLPIPDGSIDVVVSFETLEHFVEHEEFVAEVKRVLRPDGIFLVSSPNKRVYSDIPQFTNDYHVRELYYDELVTLAQSNFRNVRIYGQQLAAVSLLRTMEGDSEEKSLLQSQTPLPDPGPSPDPTYFIAVCSDGDFLPSLSSIFIDDSDFLLNDMTWAKEDSRRARPQSPPAVSVPEPIYVLGDSHSETFAMRCYDLGERRFIFRPMYVPYAQAQYFEARPDRLSRHLLGALTRAGLAVAVTPKEIDILHTTTDPHWRHIAVVRGFPHEDPAIVFALGAIDLLQFSREALGAFDDIAMPGEPVGPNAIGFDDAAERFYRKMKPFEDALVTMQSQGFSRLAVLSIVPFTSLDPQYAGGAERLDLGQRDAHLVATWRARLVQIGNATLAKIAGEVKVPFIDRQVDPSGNGLAGPGILVDGVHLDAEARDRSALAIIRTVARLSSNIELPRLPPVYQVTLDDGMSKYGLTEMTISEETFTAIQKAGSDALCELRDVNTGVVVWLNRSRIVLVVPIT